MRSWRSVVSVGAAAAITIAAAAPLRASEVSERIAAERALARRIRVTTRLSDHRTRDLQRRLSRAQRAADRRPGLKTVSVLDRAFRAERRHTRRSARHLRELSSRYLEVESWLATWAVFRVCPVDAPRVIYDDYGQIVRLPEVEPHVHRGSDITAPTWTAIRAPFDGYASASSSPLGGYQVRVFGDRGYVFNAHLIGFGQLGDVTAGTIVGYVGSTGDATAPHDHFEWHPWDGAAVDPYYLLRLTCG